MRIHYQSIPDEEDLPLLRNTEKSTSSSPLWSDWFGRVSVAPKTMALLGVCCVVLVISRALPESTTATLPSFLMGTSSVTINGEICKNPIVIDQSCLPLAPHSDKDGKVCLRNGQYSTAYCSYDLGSGTCAYCRDKDRPGIINGTQCATPIVVNRGCIQDAFPWDEEGLVCANDGGDDEAYCSYGLGVSAACAFCGDKYLYH
mmetsp:Transcript_34925/g.41713  ORF Transcript_34925/g.41713 Transcript_34925/m.41713 type:complete len:202 (+) Transcript_34925:106-711(+)